MCVCMYECFTLAPFFPEHHFCQQERERERERERETERERERDRERERERERTYKDTEKERERESGLLSVSGELYNRARNQGGSSLTKIARQSGWDSRVRESEQL